MNLSSKNFKAFIKTLDSNVQLELAELGVALRYEREVNWGWSLADVEKQTGIDYRTLSHYELGDYIPSLPALIKLADFYHVSIDSLLDR